MLKPERIQKLISKMPVGTVFKTADIAQPLNLLSREAGRMVAYNEPELITRINTSNKNNCCWRRV